jgi:hypothetical protein
MRRLRPMTTSRGRVCLRRVIWRESIRFHQVERDGRSGDTSASIRHLVGRGAGRLRNSHW